MEMDLETALSACLGDETGTSSCLDDASPARLGALDGWTFYGGKVRDNYTSPDGRTRVLITTDRLSAFDRVITTLPFKGQVLNALAKFWFDRTGEIAPNHVLDTPDPNVVVARACRPLPVEIVVRAYLTGVTSTSIYTHYARGERVFCGHALPDGLAKNARLPAPIVTPSTKAEKGDHDQSLSRAEVLARTGMDPRHFDEAADRALALFDFGVRTAAERGLILADTKYEFGIDADGKLRVIDEIHTPDSSRYWFARSYEERVGRGDEPESFDKEFVRRALIALGFDGTGPIPALPNSVRLEAARRYIAALRTITGDEFSPHLAPPLPRIAAALASL
ncbi:MAG: phosphoribosylaminoimidazolesuccinocarboxamide synthase [Polyangiaceae bacterium]